MSDGLRRGLVDNRGMDEPVPKIISRKEAKEQGLTYYFTGKPCKHGHISKRLVCDHACYACKKARSRVQMREAYRADPDAAAKKAAQRDKNPHLHQEAFKRYARKNPAFVASIRLDRRGKRHNAWSELTKEEKKAMREIYKECERLNKEAGHAAYHVDHIHPVARGGLHHPDNLQILTAEENLRKWAKYEPEDS